MDNVAYTLGKSTIAGEYAGNISKARLVVNGKIVSVQGWSVQLLCGIRIVEGI
ncbi:immunoglobulin-like domain-containing protein [Enterococcus faecalis]|uniref:immunoglobulin-like domain-containing protein n=1 Tax=Enterococcus faecalis TaxID=1351 RepID=UPI001375AFD4|nr:immunoglobulin-like domain-containing protein [Enterococcus faecalis]EGO8292464.1 hypothetical protein [Enterococcus faecalis]EHK9656742.1 hypothetical protein [Enterococcus faecalis]EHL2480978.1 hypothetical protein [Enterococcus faecalis]EHP0971854.1 hypothetical protein [Enterococcus faecalis]EKJ3570731.1 hypothetical protein [Enterococcus faecalis]